MDTGWWKTMRCPPQTFDRSEIEAIALGLAEVSHMGDPALAMAAASVLAKVAATLPGNREQQLFHAISQVYRPDVRYAEIGNVEQVRQACWQEQALDIRYQDKDGATSRRRILPLAIVYTGRALTALAWCCLRDDCRMFRLERISEIGVPGESFRPRRAALLRDYLAALHRRDFAIVPAPPR